MRVLLTVAVLKLCSRNIVYVEVRLDRSIDGKLEVIVGKDLRIEVGNSIRRDRRDGRVRWRK